MLDYIKNIICEYVEVDPASITERASLRSDLGASSFDLMNIAMAIEDTFHVSLPNAALPKVKTVGDIMTLLKNAG